jgi:hypothetical protein
MSGFPNNVSRAGFGPELRDAKPVKDPSINPSASMFNLALFQLAGASLMVPRGIIVVRGTALEEGGTVEILARYESWNSEGKSTGDYAAPTCAWVDVGEYDITYGPVPDANGNLITFTPRFPFGYGVNTDILRLSPCTVSGNTIRTHLLEANTFDAADGDVLIWFY